MGRYAKMEGIIDENIGKKYNRLTIIKKDEEMSKNKGIPFYLCECDCSNNKLISVRLNSLKTKNTKSCGCLTNENRIINGKNNRKYNTYNLSGEFGICETVKNEEFLFDLEDYEIINKNYWYITLTKYAYNQKFGMIHRLIMNCPEDMFVDHINGNTLDNRKSNLRICTRQENAYNQKKIKGYYYNKQNDKWKVRITINKKRILIGNYDTEQEARMAYLEAKIEHHGEFCPMEMIEEFNNGI